MDTDVVIVGAGPVGLALAIELALGGAMVTVLERRARPNTESRASTLHARTMEIFDQRGLLELLGSPPSDRMGHFGGLPLDLSEEPTRYPGQWKVPQTQVEEVLGQRARQLGIDIRRRHEVLTVLDTGDCVIVEFAGPAGAGMLAADYLVGCDGEDSVVRQAAGFEMEGQSATREMLRADVSGIAVPNRRFERFAGGLAIAARRSDGITRVMVHEFGAKVDGAKVGKAGVGVGKAAGGQPDFSAVVGAWQRVVGDDISEGLPIWVNAFGNASRLATSYRRGRVLLAGDAAHQQMPVGGQALNLGLQDAFNLGWKLAAQVTGTASPGLLDSYHDERHLVGQQVLDNIAAQALLLLGGSEVEAVREVVRELLRYQSVRAHLANAITGLGIRYDIGGTDDEPLVGRRMPHIEVDLANGYSSTTELLRSGRGLIVDLSANQARKACLERLAGQCNSRVEVASHVTRQVDLKQLPATVVIRPDGYVAWVGDEDSDPRAALCRWFGAAPTDIASPTEIARSYAGVGRHIN